MVWCVEWNVDVWKKSQDIQQEVLVLTENMVACTSLENRNEEK